MLSLSLLPYIVGPQSQVEQLLVLGGCDSCDVDAARSEASIRNIIALFTISLALPCLI
jgi:hypothetical protein